MTDRRLGGAFDATALVEVVLDGQSIDPRRARHQLPESDGAGRRHGFRRITALDEYDRLEILRKKQFAERARDRLRIAAAAFQPRSEYTSSVAILSEVVEILTH